MPIKKSLVTLFYLSGLLRDFFSGIFKNFVFKNSTKKTTRKDGDV